MIETVGDLIQLLHRYKSSCRLRISHRGETTQLTPVTRQEGDDVVIETIHRHAEGSNKKSSSEQSRSQSGKPDVEDAIDQCDRILTMCDELQDGDNETASDFASDIAEKVQSVRDWVEEHDHVTSKQQAALNGWEQGVSKWMK
ncbi:MAG: hypothetical protein U0872_15275 [Planctomycetaceae bacterium]